MEELLVVIVQFLCEIFIQVIAEWPCDWILYRNEDWFPEWGVYPLCLFLGGLAALLSIWVHPHTFLKHAVLRIANIGVAPSVAAALSYRVAVWRRRRGAEIDPWRNYWISFWFGLGFTLVRFGFAVR